MLCLIKTEVSYPNISTIGGIYQHTIVWRLHTLCVYNRQCACMTDVGGAYTLVTIGTYSTHSICSLHIYVQYSRVVVHNI